MDSNMFRRLHASKHIWSFNKAIAMWISLNKAWYPDLNTKYSLGKNYIVSIFNTLFPEEPILFDSPQNLL